MATVDTISPTVTTRDQRPPIGDDMTIAGEIDLAETAAWSFLSTFAFPSPDHFPFTYDASVPDVDIGAGRVARQTDSGQTVLAVGSVSGLALASGTTNYIYFDGNDDIVSKDTDAPGPNSLLLGTINTATDTVQTDVRGRSPISQFLADGTVSAGGTPVTEAPNGHLPATDLADTDFADLLVTVADGNSIVVKRWGGKTTAGTAPSGLTVALVDPGGTVVASENTLRTVNENGITSYSNTSGSPETVKLRLDNQTGSQQDAGAVFGYEVV